MRFSDIASQAVQIGQQIAPQDAAARQAVILGNILPRMMVPAFKGIISAREQNKIYTHDNVLVTAASAGAQDTETITIATHADFLWTKFNVMETSSSDNPASGTFDFFLQIVFGRNDRQWINRSQGVNPYAMVSSESEPYPLTKAEYLPRNSQVRITITNDQASARNVWVVLFGIDQYDTNLLDNTRSIE